MFRMTIAGVLGALVAAGCSTNVTTTAGGGGSGPGGSSGPGGGCSSGTTKCLMISARVKLASPYNDPCLIAWDGIARINVAPTSDGRTEVYWYLDRDSEYFFDEKYGIQVGSDAQGYPGFDSVGRSKDDSRVFAVRVRADARTIGNYKYAVQLWHRGVSSAPDVKCNLIDPIIVNREY
jgi:hypothetical protein